MSLSWIDKSVELLKSGYQEEIMKAFPNLKPIFFQNAIERDPSEFQRTVRHVFRTLKVYFLLKEGTTFHDTLSRESHMKLKKKIEKIDHQNELFLPLILIYHDIGRVYDRKNHPQKSHELLLRNDLLSPYSLDKMEKLLIDKIIQYHLLFATIYTGESTFYGIYSLLHDLGFQVLMRDTEFVSLFVDVLEIFTFIDILGYSYATVYDHYLEYYAEINRILKQLLLSSEKGEKILEQALQISKNWLEWRLAGGMRIFQFINTKSYLTKEFYFDKLKNCLLSLNVEEFKDLNWNTLKKEYLIHACKVQIKYGLGILMLLAFGSFIRKPMSKNQEISPRYLYFWLLLSKEIKRRSKKREKLPWNVFFEGLPHWSEWNKSMVKKLTEENLKAIIENAREELNDNNDEINLFLDFKIIT
ncbi:MAG: hypothetical protein ACTSYC_04620 [Promethearchaeota archaeon]